MRVEGEDLTDSDVRPVAVPTPSGPRAAYEVTVMSSKTPIRPR